jgi:hypothetical protein
MRKITIVGFAMLAWLFQAHAAAQEREVDRTLVLLMSVEGESVRVVSARLSSRQPDSAQAPAEPAVAYELTDGGNTVLFRGRMVDPTLSHAPFAPPGEPSVGHTSLRKSHAAYLLRVPYHPRYRTLKIGTTQDTAKGDRVRSVSAEPARPTELVSAARTVDLTEVMRALPIR